MWFRRDLRLGDNTALHHALRENERVVGVFVLDDAILKARDIGAARVAFLFRSLEALGEEFARRGGQLVLRRGGPPERELRTLAAEAGASALYFNRDYTPYSTERDANVTAAMEADGLAVRAFDDALLAAPQQIVDPRDGSPFQTYTSFKRVWETHLRVGKPLDTDALGARLHVDAPLPSAALPRMEDYGLHPSQDIPPAGEDAAQASLTAFARQSLAGYADNRDNTADGASTSALSVHLKYGTLSVRDCWRAADAGGGEGGRKWQDELGWRDFFNALLWHHPTMLQKAIQPALAAMRFDQNDEGWERWTTGTTGYPYVDAGIRQMLATGWMHNRTRQVAASFLCKDLLIDWRRGAEFYMQGLVDGDWAANYGGWQWVAGTAPDPNGNFRVFNPVAQQRRYDPDLAYCRRWIPELDTPKYPRPIVNHAQASEEFIRRFQKALGPPPGRRRDRQEHRPRR
jgi:deoxyribodipyrimidine photo-lyase